MNKAGYASMIVVAASLAGCTFEAQDPPVINVYVNGESGSAGSVGTAGESGSAGAGYVDSGIGGSSAEDSGAEAQETGAGGQAGSSASDSGAGGLDGADVNACPPQSDAGNGGTAGSAGHEGYGEPCPAVGTVRPCPVYYPAPETENVGVCHRGIQECQDTGDGPQWQWCYGDRTPYPWGDRCDCQDNDCDGQLDEDCGRWSFCDPLPNNADYFRGCCGSPFTPYVGGSGWPVIVKGSGSRLYWLDYSQKYQQERLHPFPSITEYASQGSSSASWEHIAALDPFDCGLAYEMSDAQLASYTMGTNVRLMPGRHVVEILDAPGYWFVQSYPNVLHPVSLGVAQEIFPDDFALRLVKIQASVAQTDYVVGVTITSAQEFDYLAEIQKGLGKKMFDELE